MSARQAAAALAAAMGIGRFVYTPILPLMTAQAGLSAASAASLATANYLGYFVGALATIVRAPSRTTNRVALTLLVATLAGMPLTHGMAAWFVLRLLAGVASAVVFVAAVNARPGWGMSGVGAGIALSGLLVLVWGQWQAAWWAAAVAAGLLAVVAWGLEPAGDVVVRRAGGRGETGRPGCDAAGQQAGARAAVDCLGNDMAARQPGGRSGADGPGSDAAVRRAGGRTEVDWPGSDIAQQRVGGQAGADKPGDVAGRRPGGQAGDVTGQEPGTSSSAATRLTRSSRRAFATLFAAYTLEGVGYIIAGTFLVAAISGPLGSTSWILVGVSAALSPVLMARLGNGRPVLVAALAVQAVGIALPAMTSTTAAALIAVVLFGGTFIGIAATALKLGSDLGFPRAAATLTAGYSAGQIIGPLIATPLLHNGYHQALLLAAAVVALAAITALAPPSRHRDATRTPRRKTPAAPAE
ncbi:YbfB/YjiJ family MFS transporter [Lentzea sp. NPDC092896]|uniref:YbfB/YjiJ family MFS transporter n=1 Tax=Lentzea sp. NPDC092896 TaxID=3364127 RepID=UPI003819F042